MAYELNITELAHEDLDNIVSYIAVDLENSRMEFDLDFDHYLIQHYPGMEREIPAAAHRP